MKAYLDIVQKILDEGIMKKNRTGVDALTIPFVHFEHNMAQGFPLLTSKKMAYKSMAVELEGFMKGITSKNWFKDRGCHFWDHWCNPTKVGTGLTQEEKLAWQSAEDDLGPLGYSWQWRRFGEVYDENDGGVLEGVDQLAKIVKTLRNNPSDRRMVCSAWNPNQIDKMALPPCHFGWYVTVINDTLNLCWFQRSVDTMIGLPHNIASYALLMKLLAKHSGLREGKLSGFLCDTHIYENHIGTAKVQLTRNTHDLPQLNVKNDDIFTFVYDKLVVTFNAKHDIELLNYVSEPKLSFEIAV